MPLKVAIGVHGRFHAFELAAALGGVADVRQVATTYPARIARRLLPPDIPLRTAPSLELIRRLQGRLDLWPRAHAFIGRRFGKFVARTLPPEIDVFLGWSGASLEALEAAKRRGALAVVERGSTHILHQDDVLRRASAASGRDFPGIDRDIVARELAEYDLADRIEVPSGFAAETFVARGTPWEKLIVNPYGVDARAFATIAERPSRARPVIVFVGGIGTRKGAQDLIAAAAVLGDRATLVMVGPVAPGFRAAAGGNVRFTGALDRPRLIAELHAADSFCLPSYEEGLALSMLQAMAAGLAVVATPETGIADVADEGSEALIVPSGRPDALAAALGILADDADRRRAMGAAAARRASTLTWAACARRAADAWQRAIGGHN